LLSQLIVSILLLHKNHSWIQCKVDCNNFYAVFLYLCNFSGKNSNNFVTARKIPSIVSICTSNLSRNNNYNLVSTSSTCQILYFESSRHDFQWLTVAQFETCLKWWHHKNYSTNYNSTKVSSSSTQYLIGDPGPSRSFVHKRLQGKFLAPKLTQIPYRRNAHVCTKSTIDVSFLLY